LNDTEEAEQRTSRKANESVVLLSHTPLEIAQKKRTIVLGSLERGHQELSKDIPVITLQHFLSTFPFSTQKNHFIDDSAANRHVLSIYTSLCVQCEKKKENESEEANSTIFQSNARVLSSPHSSSLFPLRKKSITEKGSIHDLAD
jgi:hypothetical protein